MEISEAGKAAILSQARNLLAAIGGVLVAHGVVTAGWWELASGVATVALPYVWGIWNAYSQDKKAAAREHVALNVGIAIANSQPNVITPPIDRAQVAQVIAAVAPAISQGAPAVAEVAAVAPITQPGP